MNLKELVNVPFPDIEFTDKTKERMRFTYQTRRYDKEYGQHREKVLSQEIP